jgi:hypothetical protein
MGPRLKLPRYVHGFLDRHGKPRFYFRRAGFEAKPLHGLPYSPEFMADYQAALADQPLPVGTKRVPPGTMHASAVELLRLARIPHAEAINAARASLDYRTGMQGPW